MSVNRNISERSCAAQRCRVTQHHGITQHHRVTQHHGVTQRRSAFTLLEVVLALSLTVILVSAIVSAVRLNIMMLERHRIQIEQTQVARSVLQVVARDLRAAVQHKPADVSGLSEIMAGGVDPSALLGGADPSALEGAMGGLDPSMLEGLAGGGGGGSSAPGVLSGNESFDTGSISANSSQPRHPGLYGNESQLSVDISRLPRLDEYSAQLVGDGYLSIPSDVKTVAYYVEQETQSGTISFDLMSDLQLGGLYRRSSDRAVAVYAYDAGGDLSSFGNRELIAPEVAEIRFRYFDGTDWQTEWDSDQSGGFPSAIEVTVVIDPARVEKQTQNEYQYNGFEPGSMSLYRSVVYLPVAEILPQEELDLIEQGNDVSESGSESQ